MENYVKGSLLIILGALSAFVFSVYQLIWSRTLFINGPLEYYQLLQLQSWFWVFTIFSGFNIIIWIYCIYKGVDLSLKGYFILSPFIIMIVACLSIMQFFSNTNLTQYIGDSFSYQSYIILIMFFDVILFLGTYILIKEKMV